MMYWANFHVVFWWFWSWSAVYIAVMYYSNLQDPFFSILEDDIFRIKRNLFFYNILCIFSNPFCIIFFFLFLSHNFFHSLIQNSYLLCLQQQWRYKLWKLHKKCCTKQPHLQNNKHVWKAITCVKFPSRLMTV